MILRLLISFVIFTSIVFTGYMLALWLIAGVPNYPGMMGVILLAFVLAVSEQAMPPIIDAAWDYLKSGFKP